LTKKKSIYIPAFAVYLYYYQVHPDEPRLMPATSNGLACGTSLEDATLRAIFELIERDAAMITWYAQRIVPRLNLDFKYLVLPELKILLEKIFEEGFRVEVFISTLNIPIPSVIGCIYSQRKTVPYASFGLATEVDLERAALKAVLEALMVHNTVEIIHNQQRLKLLKASEVRTFLDHAVFYSFVQHKKYWEFLLKGPLYPPRKAQKVFNFSNNGFTKLENVIDFFRRKQMEIIQVDLTKSVVKKNGYRVVKAIVPGLHPLDVNHKACFLGSKRLNMFLSDSGKISSYPHPFS
jgi:ribosomal protein S12 methylthiotransferase accessory factor